MTTRGGRDRLPAWVKAVLVALAFVATDVATAQNDWQYPDPYFGILELEKSHGGAVARRPRSEATAPPRGKPAFSRQGFFRSRRTTTSPRQR